MTHGKYKRNFEIFTAEELIAAITQHFPEKQFQMVRYFEWYSSRSRGERTKAELLRLGDEPPHGEETPEVAVLGVSDYQPPRIPSKTWRELIKKILEVDPLSCPRCGHEMKIISLINEPQVIRKIVEHLGLWNQSHDDRGNQSKTPRLGPAVSKTRKDGRPRHEQPATLFV